VHLQRISFRYWIVWPAANQFRCQFSTISLYDGLKCGTLECEHMDSWNKYNDKCDLKMYWFGAIDVLGGAVGIGPSSGQGQLAGGAGRWFPPFSRMMLMLWNDLLMDDILLNPWQRWNDDETFDWILDECCNDYEMLIEFLINVEMTMKMLMFLNDLLRRIYIIVLPWIINRLWDVNWAVMKLGC
jgi:hypothetical protein